MLQGDLPKGRTWWLPSAPRRTGRTGKMVWTAETGLNPDAPPITRSDERRATAVKLICEWVLCEFVNRICDSPAPKHRRHREPTAKQRQRERNERGAPSVPPWSSARAMGHSPAPSPPETSPWSPRPRSRPPLATGQGRTFTLFRNDVGGSGAVSARHHFMCYEVRRYRPEP